MKPTMPSILAERTLTTVGLAKRLAAHGGACAAHRQTINRWIRTGVRVGGKRVKLDAIRLGGKWITSEEAFERFQAALTTRAGGAVAPVQSPAQRKRRTAALKAQFDRNLS